MFLLLGSWHAQSSKFPIHIGRTNPKDIHNMLQTVFSTCIFYFFRHVVNIYQISDFGAPEKKHQKSTSRNHCKKRTTHMPFGRFDCLKKNWDQRHVLLPLSRHDLHEPWRYEIWTEKTLLPLKHWGTPGNVLDLIFSRLPEALLVKMESWHERLCLLLKYNFYL